MTHGDDDGLRVPPAIAPQQIVIIPMLREAPEDAELLTYCEAVRAALTAQTALGEKVRVLLDTKPGKAAAKRWDWVRKGAPVIVEVGPRDMAEGKLAVLRRDALWNADNGKPAFTYPAHADFTAEAGALLEAIQQSLFDEARNRRDANITRGVTDWAAVVANFENGGKYPGWVEVEWSKPTGAALDAVVEKLKALKLTIRNVPRGGEPATGTCIFTGEPAAERILIARAY
jgi:prolyl-tRNA synthetase